MRFSLEFRCRVLTAKPCGYMVASNNRICAVSYLPSLLWTRLGGRRDNMDFITITQIAQGVSNIFSVIVIALGYYALIRVTQKSVEEMRAQRLAGGRPTVIVDDNYNNLPEIDIVIRNMVGGPAKDITFEFSAPIESSSGYCISDLQIFKNGLAFLSPNTE